MGNLLSNFFQTGTSLLSSSNNRGVSEQTKSVVRDVFDALRANPRITAHRLEGLLMQIPKNENFLLVNNEEGYNLLQICVGIANMDMVKWILTRNPDLNRFTQCSLPLHIACYKGLDDCVELLMKHGARIDVEARMCWPGPHLPNCEQRVNQDDLVDQQVPVTHGGPQHGFWGQQRRGCDKLQSAICYAIDGDQVETLELLMQQSEDHWFPWHGKRPLLHIACERGAWSCTRYLVSERSEEINQCYDEYYPIHQAVLHDQRFLDLLIQCGAETTVRTATQQMTVLHILFLLGWKSAEETLSTLKLLLDHGSRDQINQADSLGNTPLHALIVRCALEESRYGYAYDSPIQPWNKWDMLHLVRFLLQNGAGPSINQAGNSALACVFQKVRDWEFRYELLDMLLQHKGDPNVVGRDGSVPLMVCLVPLINKDSPQHFTHTMKVFYLNCVKLMCKKGANPNCCTRSNLSPLHVLMFSVSENLTLRWNEEKNESFQFLQDLLIVLLEHGLDPNVRFSQRNPHVLFALVEMASRNARNPPDLHPVCELTRTLLLYGANPNACCHLPQLGECQLPPPAVVAGRPKESSFLKRLHQGGHYALVTYVQWLLKKGDVFLVGGPAEEVEHYMRLVNLYYASMSHQDLSRCLKALQNVASLAPATKGTAFLASRLRQLHSTPRSLKMNCRVVIYKSLNRKPGVNASRLPLPTSLKEYICALDPR